MAPLTQWLSFSFRLILAMDPRYGEISRAMRNRGVEVFMLGEVCFDCSKTYRQSQKGMCESTIEDKA